MADLSKKTVLITGGSSGIGLEAAVQLAKMGAEVTLVARDKGRLEAAARDAKQRSGSATVAIAQCDFASQASIRAFAGSFIASHPRLDILVNNAGAVSPKRQVTVDGLEQTFAVNHLGYFLLTNLLLDLIRKSAPARIVNVASVGHRRGDMDFDDLQLEKDYGIIRAYSRSKLGNVFFTRELAKRLEGTGVTVNCIGPGPIGTAIWSKAPWFTRPILALGKLFMTTPEEGGSWITFLAAGEEVAGKTGGYYEKNKLVWPSRLSQDDAISARLWDVSAKLVKLP